MYQCGKAKWCLNGKLMQRRNSFFHPPNSPQLMYSSRFSSHRHETNTDDVKGNEGKLLKRENENEHEKQTTQEIQTKKRQPQKHTTKPEHTIVSLTQTRKKTNQTSRWRKERQSNWSTLPTPNHQDLSVRDWTPRPNNLDTQKTKPIEFRTRLCFWCWINPDLIHFLHDSRLLIFSGWDIVYFCIRRWGRRCWFIIING